MRFYLEVMHSKDDSPGRNRKGILKYPSWVYKWEKETYVGRNLRDSVSSILTFNIN